MKIENRFSNVIMCEDIRDELGNKKSLMGVVSGDLLVQSFPANVRMAFYAEYQPPPDAGEHEIAFELLIAEAVVASGTVNIPAGHPSSTTLVLPQGVATISGEGQIILRIGNSSGLFEIIKKKVLVQPPAT